jgi:hypothetical protein
MERSTSFYESGRRYKSLQLIGALFTLSGAVQLAIGALLLAFGLYSLLSGTAGAGAAPPETGPLQARQVDVVAIGTSLLEILSRYPLLSLYGAIGCLFSGLQSVAFGALIRLLINLDYTARASARALDKIEMRFESRREGVEPLFRS